MTYREAKIPKKGKGKFRKIVMPDKELLHYQRGKLKELQQDYVAMALSNDIADVAHGFLRGRNVVTAAEKHVGFKATIMFDISEFFDSVHYGMVPEKWHDGLLYDRGGNTGQGFSTSPMLANIAAIPMVKAIKELLDEKFGDYAYTWYADDIQVSVNTEDKKKLNSTIAKVYDIIEASGFKANKGKTRIKYAKFGFRRILGVNVGDEVVRATRKTMKKIRAAAHQNNGPSLGGLRNWSNCNKPKVRD